jgi:formylglycine-generating enzyme required for sulfatase activity
MTHDVFLSYSNKDKAAADAICEALETAQIRVWMAPRDILPGAGWAQSIIGAINGARVMVLVFSRNANGSPQIEREVERAVHKGVAVVPVRIEDVPPSEALEFFISAPHWLDAFPPPYEPHFARLAEDVKRLLESPFVRKAPGAPGPAEAKRAEEESAEAARRMEEEHGRHEQADAAERKLAEAEASRRALEERLIEAERQVKEAAARTEEEHRRREQAEEAQLRLAEAEASRRVLEERLRQAEAARNAAERSLRETQTDAAKRAEAEEERRRRVAVEAALAVPAESAPQPFPAVEPKAPVEAPVGSKEPSPPPVPPQRPLTVAPILSSKPIATTSPCGGVTPSSFSFRAAAPLSANEECALQAKAEFKECENCPTMVVVPPGSFTMGSPENEPSRDVDEGPQREVRIGKAFAAGMFAVTFGEWDACVAEAGCNRYRPDDRGWGRGRLPVINVTWDDAQAYVTWLSKKTGKIYRLLSEAEWEYSARGGTTTTFWWGASISTAQANYNGDYTYNGGPKGEYRHRTVAVDSFRSNPFGLYNVHGNVWQWVEDCYHNNYSGAGRDGSAWTTGDCGRRVLRGGSWSNGPWYLRAAVRFGTVPDYRIDNVGFRVARTLAP